jgi:hypothetical protein
MAGRSRAHFCAAGPRAEEVTCTDSGDSQRRDGTDPAHLTEHPGKCCNNTQAPRSRPLDRRETARSSVGGDERRAGRKHSRFPSARCRGCGPCAENILIGNPGPIWAFHAFTRVGSVSAGAGSRSGRTHRQARRRRDRLERRPASGRRLTWRALLHVCALPPRRFFDVRQPQGHGRRFRRRLRRVLGRAVSGSGGDFRRLASRRSRTVHVRRRYGVQRVMTFRARGGEWRCMALAD